MFESVVRERSPKAASYQRVGKLAVGALAVTVVTYLIAGKAGGNVSLGVAAAVVWLPAFGILFRTSRNVGNPERRAALQAVLVAGFFAPSLIVGEGGAAPAPAIITVFMTGQFVMAAGSLLVVGFAAFAYFLSHSASAV
jgi:hypothetical protein